MQIKKGLTRWVLLTKNYAIKFPRIYWGFRFFAIGLLGNLNEGYYYKNFKNYYKDKFCPVIFNGGFFLIMPRLDICKFKEEIDFEKFAGIPFDPNVENFGYYHGQIVLVDYGSNLEFVKCGSQYCDEILLK